MIRFFEIMFTEVETFGRSICMNILVSVDQDILQPLLIKSMLKVLAE